MLKEVGSSFNLIFSIFGNNNLTKICSDSAPFLASGGLDPLQIRYSDS